MLKNTFTIDGSIGIFWVNLNQYERQHEVTVQLQWAVPAGSSEASNTELGKEQTREHPAPGHAGVSAQREVERTMSSSAMISPRASDPAPKEKLPVTIHFERLLSKQNELNYIMK